MAVGIVDRSLKVGRFPQDFGRVGGQGVAMDDDAAVGADKTRTAGNPGLAGIRASDHLHPVGELEQRRTVPHADRDGTGVIGPETPLDDVVMVLPQLMSPQPNRCPLVLPS